jgi:hypothetical protein
MALPLVLAFHGASRGRWLGVLPWIAVGVLVKWVAAVAAPFALVLLWRRHGPGKALASAALALAVAVPPALPYLADGSALRLDDLLATWGKPSTSFAAGLGDLWRYLARAVPSLEPTVEPVGRAIRVAFFAGFGLFWGWRSWRAARNPGYGAGDLLEDGVLSLLVLLCVAESAFAPWHVGLFLPAALLLPEGHRLRRVSVALSVTELLGFTFVAKARILDALLMTGLALVLFLRARPPHRSGAAAGT